MRDSMSSFQKQVGKCFQPWQNSPHLGNIQMHWKKYKYKTYSKRKKKHKDRSEIKFKNARNKEISEVNMLETTFKDVVAELLEILKVIRQIQHDFVKRKICFINLLEFYWRGTNAMNMDESMVVQCLDFQKTFDKRPHQRPLQKIKPYGIWNYTGGDWWTSLEKLGINRCPVEELELRITDFKHGTTHLRQIRLFLFSSEHHTFWKKNLWIFPGRHGNDWQGALSTS